MYKQIATQYRPVVSAASTVRSPWFCHISSIHQNTNNPADDDEQKPPPTDFEVRLAEDKARLQWRTPLFEQKDKWYTKFKVFGSDKNENTDIIGMLQKPIDLSVQGFKDRRERKRVKIEKFMQQYIPERHQILGNDLAAAHFLVHRGGSVK